MYKTTDWQRLFMNNLPLSFLPEVALRSFIMFIIILLAMRAPGKRGIKQLSVLELLFALSSMCLRGVSPRLHRLIFALKPTAKH